MSRKPRPTLAAVAATAPPPKRWARRFAITELPDDTPVTAECQVCGAPLDVPAAAFVFYAGRETWKGEHRGLVTHDRCADGVQKALSMSGCTVHRTKLQLHFDRPA